MKAHDSAWLVWLRQYNAVLKELETTENEDRALFLSKRLISLMDAQPPKRSASFILGDLDWELPGDQVSIDHDPTFKHVFLFSNFMNDGVHIEGREAILELIDLVKQLEIRMKETPGSL